MYNIPMQFGIPTKLVWLIKMCLKETYSRAQAGKRLSAMFPVKKTLKRDVLHQLRFNIALDYAIRKVRVIQNV